MQTNTVVHALTEIHQAKQRSDVLNIIKICALPVPVIPVRTGTCRTVPVLSSTYRYTGPHHLTGSTCSARPYFNGSYRVCEWCACVCEINTVRVCVRACVRA